jgi:hypothetical protein
VQAAAPPADHLPAPHTRHVEEPVEGAYCPGGLRCTLITTGAGSVGLPGWRTQGPTPGCRQPKWQVPSSCHPPNVAGVCPLGGAEGTFGTAGTAGQQHCVRRSSEPQASNSPHVCIFLARRRAARRLHAVPSWHRGPCRATERRGLTTACTSWLAWRRRTRHAAPPCSWPPPPQSRCPGGRGHMRCWPGRRR